MPPTREASPARPAEPRPAPPDPASAPLGAAASPACADATPAQPAAVAPAADPELLAPPGSERRWWQLQGLRRGRVDPGPFLAAMESGELPAQQDLLAALLGVLDRDGVERLLANPDAGAGPALLEAGRLELPPLAGQERQRQAWLQPLLDHHQRLALQDPAGADRWLELLGPFRHPEVAARLRQALLRHLGRCGQQPLAAALSSEATTVAHAAAALDPALPALQATKVADAAATLDPGAQALPPPLADAAVTAWAAVEALAPLLGLQRQPQDGALLLELTLAPGPLERRRAAMEGLALGLSAWPQQALSAGLVRLSGDLDPQLAANAVDLLARLPQSRQALRRVARRSLDPAVRARLRRRLPAAPLVLLVHGRQGGEIPSELQALAAELRQRRGGPVLLQSLTGEAAPQPEAAFWPAAERAGGLTLVPLLLLPGGHVRHDLPALAQAWRERARGQGALELWRQPFLGAWPAWQQQLRRQLIALAAGQPLLWLHHPLDGPLGARYLEHLSRLLGHPGQPAPLEAGIPRPAGLREPGLLVPWSLAANRMSEALAASDPLPGQRLLPPLLQIPSLRHTLLELLSALP
ncbi:MAG: CbiX/SirB N-terminal domain-containing protein [Synechococcaceae cyanobacterium]